MTTAEEEKERLLFLPFSTDNDRERRKLDSFVHAQL